MENLFGKRLVELLEIKDLTQAELAERTGTTGATISRYVAGLREPKGSIVAAIASELGTTSAYLLGETDDPAPAQKIEAYDMMPGVDVTGLSESDIAALNVMADRLRKSKEEK